MSLATAFNLVNVSTKFVKNQVDAKQWVEELDIFVAEKVQGEIKELATKEDLMKAEHNIMVRFEKMETKMSEGFRDQLKWIIGIIITFLSIILATIFALIKFGNFGNH
jgi:hypothetical protein